METMQSIVGYRPAAAGRTALPAALHMSVFDVSMTA